MVSNMEYLLLHGLLSKSSDEHLIVLLDEIQTTIIGYKCCDLLAILCQLYPDALPMAEFGCLHHVASTLLSPLLYTYVQYH